METYLERVKKWNDEQVESAKDRIAQLANTLPTRKRVAEALDLATVDHNVIYDWVGNNLEFTFNSVEEAREVVDKLLELLEVDKAEKNFDGWKSEPQWFYEIVYRAQTIKVRPAEPSEDCVPVAKASSSVYWVCEKK